MNDLTPYDPAYLSGYKAQRYQVELTEGFELAKHLAAPVIDSDVRAGIGGGEQRVESINTVYSAITFKHLLLPVYVGAYRFGEKVYQVVVNGRTGEVKEGRGRGKGERVKGRRLLSAPLYPFPFPLSPILLLVFLSRDATKSSYLNFKLRLPIAEKSSITKAL